MVFMSRTKAVADKLIADIKKLVYCTTIVVQCIFFVFYSYSIYNNIDHLIFLITYSLLFVLAIITFVNYLITYNKPSRKVRKFKRFLRIFKYIINGFMILVNIYEIIKYAEIGFNIILLMISSISLFAQLVIEFIRIFTEKYIELFVTSAKMDFQGVSKIAKLKNVKASVYGLVDAPLKAIANKIEKKPVLRSETEVYVDQLAEDSIIKSKQKKAEKRQEMKRKFIETTEMKKQEIVEHFDVIKNKIFKKNKK